MIGRLLFILILFSALTGVMTVQAQTAPIAIAIHGGAGTIRKENMTAEKEEAIRQKLEESLQAGYLVLQQGGESMDAIQAAIMVLENSPLFNAGKGAVFSHEGRNELDSSIMDGKTLNAGAVAGVTTVKNPITLARAVMEKSPHVLLSGKGAETFANEVGIELVEPEYFHTERRWKQLQRARERGQSQLESLPDDMLYSTVGAVALDQNGNLAAGTSTGGMTNKRYGRIGDSPIIGAGTYASNDSCAVSATGHGEYFIRSVVAYDICARMQYSQMSLAEAADQVVMKTLVERGGDGGVIALDGKGNIALVFNTPGMYRGSINASGKMFTGLYKD